MREPHPIGRRAWISRAARLACAAGWRAPLSRAMLLLPGVPGRSTAPIRLDLPQLRYPGRWQPRAAAMRELAVEIRLRTRLEPMDDPTSVEAESPDLFRSPFLYVAGQDPLPAFGPRARANLRAFVSMGGLLLLDAADGGAAAEFSASAAALVAQLLPGRTLTPLHREHVLYRTFYVLDRPVGRTAALPHLLAVQDQGRLQVLFMPNDLGGALTRRPDGLYALPCTPGGPTQREHAIRLGVNILMYATCLDYKADPAHVETLLRARRWR